MYWPRPHHQDFRGFRGHRGTSHRAVIDDIDEHVANDFADAEARRHRTEEVGTGERRPGLPPTAGAARPRTVGGPQSIGVLPAPATGRRRPRSAMTSAASRWSEAIRPRRGGLGYREWLSSEPRCHVQRGCFADSGRAHAGESRVASSGLSHQSTSGVDSWRGRRGTAAGHNALQNLELCRPDPDCRLARTVNLSHRVRARNATIPLRRLALSQLKQYPGTQTVAMKRRSCGWSEDFMM